MSGKETYHMNSKRLESLSEFLAGLTDPCINISVSRPFPDILDVFVVKAFLKLINKHIGKQNSEILLKEIQDCFSRIEDLEKQIDNIWTKYDSDKAFFAHLETLLSRQKHD